jgi:8-oxo-dGTP pyrophosphatase MutT (NUDIX family)
VDSADRGSDAVPTDPAVRVLAEAAGEARVRRPEDGADPAVPVAGTAVIVRDAEDGPQVLMIERPDRGSFAGAWVFPGGKREPADGDGEEAVVARHAAVRETREETGLELDGAGLLTLSCWDPPPGLPLRIRTWFYLSADPGGELTFAPDEVLTGQWVRPADMMERHARGAVTLYPPTWVTLHELAGQPDAAALFALVRISGVRRYDTVARRGSGGPLLLWHGDSEYENTGSVGDAGVAASRHRLDLAALPWVYTRSG